MIVTCPACATRFQVDPHALGTVGRRVRCAACAHVWHQASTPAVPLRPDAPAREPGGPAAAPALPELALLSEQPRRRSRLRVVAAGALALALVAAAMAAVWQRERVAALWPPAARLYALVGLPVRGLELRQLTPTREIENGVPTLVVAGEVANVSDTARQVPKLRLALRDSGQHELRSWTVTVSDQPLAPGASISFRTSLAEPDPAATDVLVTFAGGD